MGWWTTAVDRLYPIWSAGIVLVLGGLAQAVAVAAGWVQAPRTRLLVIAGTFLAAVLAAAAQLRYTAWSQQPTSHRLPWNIPPPSESFTGRRQELAVLRRQLGRRPDDRTVPTMVVAGIPGVGKTQLARAYAYRFRRQYRLGWWLAAETNMTLDGSLRALADRLGLDGDSPLDTLAEELRQALAGRRRWFLVFDNADQPAQLAPFLPRHGRGQVLITSRHDRWQHLAEPLQITPLPVEDAAKALLARTGDNDPDAARALVEALHRLPLAVEQAAAYLGSQPDLSIAGYLELFRTHEQQLLSRGTPLHYQEGRTVAAVVAIVIQQLGDATAAGQLLRLCAFLAPDQLPLRLLLSRPGVLPEPLADAAAGEVMRREAVDMLYRLGLFTDDLQDTVQLHRLLQDAVRLHLPDDEQRTCAQHTIDLLDELLDDEDAAVEADNWAVLSPHIDAALGHALSLDLAFDALGRLLTTTGQYLQDRQQFSAARDRYHQVLAIWRRVYGDGDHPDIAASLTNLGIVLDDLGESPAARDHYEQALAMRRRLHGDGDHPNIAASLDNLGIVLGRLGELPVARDHHEQALAMRRRLYGDGDHPDIATSLTNLGVVLRRLGELPAARDHYEQALAMWRRLYGGGDHPNVATSLDNLGVVLRQLGNRRAAARLEVEADAIKQRLFEQQFPIPPGLKEL